MIIDHMKPAYIPVGEIYLPFDFSIIEEQALLASVLKASDIKNDIFRLDSKTINHLSYAKQQAQKWAPIYSTKIKRRL